MGLRSLKRQKWLITILGCLVLSLVFCIPMLNQTFVSGSDTSFHINRIIALSTSIKNGDLYPRIFWNQNYSFGYGSPMLYSFFFLYIPALLHLWGMAVLDAYRCLLFLIAFWSAFTMYQLAKRVTRNEPSAWISAAFYLFNPFFYSNVYKRGAVGEELAYIFVPVVLLAVYELFYAKEKGKHWQYLIIGFGGLLLSHNITFLIMVGVFIILALINLKKMIRQPEILLHILLAAGITIALTAFYTFPMMEQLNSGSYRISSYFTDSAGMASSAMTFSDLFSLDVSGNTYFNASPGIVVMVLAVFTFLPHARNVSVYRKTLAAIGLVLVFMATDLFPWPYVQVFNFMQFPTRFVNVSAACLSLAAGREAWDLRIPHLNRRQARLILGSAMGVILVINLTQLYQNIGIYNNSVTDEEFHDDEKFCPDEKYWYDVMELSTPDYLPAGTDISYRDYGRLITINSRDHLIEMDETEYGVFSFSTEKTIGNGYYQVPKTYYKGYTAKAYRDGQYLNTYETKMDPTTGLVSFNVTDAADGPITIVVTYEPTALQTACANISWIAFLLYLIFNLLNLLRWAIRRQRILSKRVNVRQ